uniref:DUF1725 domain-containing protein n=1 Tax=Callithrix jacchus TaxID=9483 RepID=A0A8I3WJQ2_CALJA
MFIAALFTIAKSWNQPKCPLIIDWIGKMWHIYTMEYYAAIRNDEFVSFVGTWMNLENIILSKLTQEQKMKHRIFSLIAGWNKDNQTTLEASCGTWKTSLDQNPERTTENDYPSGPALDCHVTDV